MLGAIEKRSCILVLPFFAFGGPMSFEWSLAYFLYCFQYSYCFLTYVDRNSVALLKAIVRRAITIEKKI